MFVPEAAVQAVDGKDVVFVRQNDGGFAMQDVTTEPASQGLVPILTGLRAGQQVAVNGAFILKSKVLKEKLGDQD